MFYVSISEEVLDKIMDEARATNKEIIGILVGNMENHTIVIEDALSGEQESDAMRASLPPKTIAKIADRILSEEIDGRIMGWYHSHPGFGLFMSPTDINTQKNFQQFCSKITALIVEPVSGEFGFFTLHDSEDVIQLEKEQVHVYSEGEERIPKRFSSPPEIPKPVNKSYKKPAVPSKLIPHAKESNTRFIAFGVAVVLILLIIGGMLILDNIRENSKHSGVDNILLFGDVGKNQQDIPIFMDQMEVRVNVTIDEGRITQEGVRFYLSSIEREWKFLGNVSIHHNNTFTLGFDTKAIDEGMHQIKVNFTDTLDNTWEEVSEPFIIDNIPDFPEPRFLDPRDGDTIGGEVILYAEVMDEEDNVHSVTFYCLTGSGNWSLINETKFDKFVYITIFDTNKLSNGTYQIKVKAEDRNLYIGEEVISVNVLNGG